MKPITQEWVDKAEGDFATAQREINVEDKPNYDAVCFHSQQCIEKYLKACLQENNIAFGRTHDLTKLLDAFLTVEPSWGDLRNIDDSNKKHSFDFAQLT
jgi:HEPN domain-containing protein